MSSKVKPELPPRLDLGGKILVDIELNQSTHARAVIHVKPKECPLQPKSQTRVAECLGPHGLQVGGLEIETNLTTGADLDLGGFFGQGGSA